MDNTQNNYNANSIKVLEGLEAVRKRPAMYIGSTDVNGLHHLVWEVIDNSIDEALAGYCNRIYVKIKKDNSIEVEDNGRGIPVDIHSEYKIPAVELIMTKLHAGGKFEKNAYKISGGLHGVGVSCVNALSTYLEVYIIRDGKIYYQRYERGITKTKLEVLGELSVETLRKLEDRVQFYLIDYINSSDIKNHTGTKVIFSPDPEIFKETTVFHYDRIAERLRELAFLNPGLEITIEDERNGKKEVFHYEGGLVEFVNFLDSGKTPLHKEVIVIEKKDYEVPLQIAFRYNTEYSEIIFSYVNNIRTKDGGTHVSGFRSALTASINKYIKDHNLLTKQQSKLQITGDDVKEGLTAVVSVYVKEPQFEGQTKGRLGNSEVRGIVYSIVKGYLDQYFEDNPKIAEAICKKVINNAEAREAARKAKQIKRKNFLDSTSLPGKLTDCISKDPAKSELFIVEGDSAGGNAKQGRDRNYQAILPLKGKILNVEKSNPHKILTNDEIKSIITALGTGFGDNFDISKLRYGKIIFVTDADVDGSHIQILLLTLFYRYLKPLIENGHVYIAMPPLYKIKARSGKKEKIYYVYTEEEKDKKLKDMEEKGEKLIQVQRFKGLGEMDKDELWETTMNYETRILKRVTIEDAIVAEQIFSILMGENVEERKKFIQENALYVKNLDI